MADIKGVGNCIIYSLKSSSDEQRSLRMGCDDDHLIKLNMYRGF